MIWLLAIAAILVSGCARDEAPPPPPPVRAAFEPPPGAELGTGDDVLDAAMSPGGEAIVFVATTGGVPALWRRALDAERAERLPGTEGAALPAWKRTGGVVAFFAGGRLRQVALGDGVVRDLADAPSPGGAAWLPDGSLLFSPEANGPVQRLRNGAATAATTLRSGDVAHRFPQAVGDAGDFLYVAQLANRRRMVRLVRGSGDVDLARTSGHAVLVGEWLVHVVEGALTAQRFDAEAGALAGRAARLAFDVGVASSGRAFFAASPRVIVWAASAPRSREVVWFDSNGQRIAALGDPADAWQVRLSPDDRLAAVTMVDPLVRTLDVFIRPADGAATVARRMTLSLSADSDPVWAPDASRVAFRSLQAGQPDLFSRPPQFSEEEDRVVLRSELDETPSDWRAQPGAQGTLLFHAPGQGTGLDVWALDVATGERRAVARGGFNESDARWSPDGRWIAYVGDESGRPEIVVERWPSDGRARRATSAGGTRPRWRRDGRALFFMREGTLMELPFQERGGEPSFGEARRVAELSSLRDYDIAHRSDRILAILPVARSVPASARLIVDWQPPRP